MSTAIAASNATPVAGKTGVNLSVTGAPANTATGYDNTKYPASPAITYYISLDKTGATQLRSPVFTPDAVNGDYLWPAVIIPSAGSWTANLRTVSNDSSVANVAITAS